MKIYRFGHTHFNFHGFSSIFFLLVPRFGPVAGLLPLRRGHQQHLSKLPLWRSFSVCHQMAPCKWRTPAIVHQSLQQRVPSPFQFTVEVFRSINTCFADERLDNAAVRGPFHYSDTYQQLSILIKPT